MAPSPFILPLRPQMKHQSGFVNIIGKPNVGKSTLMNALLGENLSIVTNKAQTTRHRIKGILNNEQYQIIFSDTPGMLKPVYKLHEKMMEAVDETLTDADIVIFLIEVKETKIEEELLTKLQFLKVPVLLVMNKVDETDQETIEAQAAHWKELLNPTEIIPISALHKFYLDVLLKKIVQYLPEGEAYFDKDDNLSDRDMRFFASEIIREKILLFYQKEIPYSVEVKIQSYKENQDIDVIKAFIYTARESQKAIILGHGGAAIKKVGTEARKKLEEMLGKKVYLELTVKVIEDWRNDEQSLKRFGYDS